MSITIINPQCGETVYTITTALVCGTLPDHEHCKPEDCPEGAHGGAPHCIIEHAPERNAALQVQSIEIRKFLFTETTRDPTTGKANHVEARGVVAIEETPIQKDPEVCARSTHRHVTEAANEADIHRGAKQGEMIEKCVIANYYPITLRMDLPIGDGCLPFLGDNLIVSVRRAVGRLEHQYRVE